jgi:hypothetical protein
MGQGALFGRRQAEFACTPCRSRALAPGRTGCNQWHLQDLQLPYAAVWVREQGTGALDEMERFAWGVATIVSSTIADKASVLQLPCPFNVSESTAA